MVFSEDVDIPHGSPWLGSLARVPDPNLLPMLTLEGSSEVAMARFVLSLPPLWESWVESLAPSSRLDYPGPFRYLESEIRNGSSISPLFLK